MEIKPIKSFHKQITVAPDKSITHRAIMLNAIADGKATIKNALMGDDCLATIECMRSLGARIEVQGDVVTVFGTKRLNSSSLYVGNSGTTFRLLTGLLSGVDGQFTIDGDASIRRRPMKRVIEPLSLMGADLKSFDGKAPVIINGKKLKSIVYNMPISSAQVKSALLLAGMNADGITTITEKVSSRNHTEVMLEAMGAKIWAEKGRVSIMRSILRSLDLTVPGDISSGAYPLVLASCLKDASVTINKVGVNSTRTGVLTVLKECGIIPRLTAKKKNAEPSADVTVSYGEKKPFVIDKPIIPYLIDEIPVLAVLACFIEGESVIRGAEELKVKESNRIDTTVNALKAMGADITATDDGMIIRGKGYLKGGVTIDPMGDHRIAMAMSVAGALSQEGVNILNPECVAISYPNFFELFKE